MALLGTAALAMWWELSPGMREEFEHWHSHEHFPERLAIPGFLRASRWTRVNGGDGIFVMYELASYDVLSSSPYLARLNAPTDWSRRMMPHHHNMMRSQCRVLESRGSGVARQAFTVRLSPVPGRDAELRDGLNALGHRLFDQPGLSGMHLLRHQAPQVAQTTEQKIRGVDQVADWVFVGCGYDSTRLSAVADIEFTEDRLVGLGAERGRVVDFHDLSHTATPADMA